MESLEIFLKTHWGIQCNIFLNSLFFRKYLEESPDDCLISKKNCERILGRFYQKLEMADEIHENYFAEIVTGIVWNIYWKLILEILNNFLENFWRNFSGGVSEGISGRVFERIIGGNFVWIHEGAFRNNTWRNFRSIHGKILKKNREEEWIRWNFPRIE